MTPLHNREDLILSLLHLLGPVSGFAEGENSKDKEEEAHVDRTGREQDAEPLGKVLPLHLVGGQRLWTRCSVGARPYL